MLGCNFPIILSFPGTVDYLRNQGYDMFDDIINHGYDTINEPFVRLSKAILENSYILKNGDFAKQKWKNNMHRFEHNVDLWKQKTNRTIQLAHSNFDKLLQTV